MEKIKIEKKIREIIDLEKAFISVDLAIGSGRIIIQDKNPSYPKIMSKFVEIDTLLTHELDSDILDSIIQLSYPNQGEDIRVVIRFDYD